MVNKWLCDISDMPGCCGMHVVHQFWNYPGEGRTLTQIESAGFSVGPFDVPPGVGLLFATTNQDQATAVADLKRRKWEVLRVFTNPKTNNTVTLWCKLRPARGRR